MRKNFVLCFFLLWAGVALAQNPTKLQGVVKADYYVLIPSVTILEKVTTKGVVTDLSIKSKPIFGVNLIGGLVLKKKRIDGENCSGR